MTHAFFTKLLEKNLWSPADPSKGRSRSLLLTALRQFVADQRDRARTAKRGNRASVLSLDEGSGEQQFPEGVDRNLSPKQQFDLHWAFAVLDEARAKLHQECITTGKSGLYDRIDLLDDKTEKSLSYAEVAGQLGMSISAVKSAVLRLRRRYGDLVCEVVARPPGAGNASARKLMAYLCS